jgi:hypothetical protein
MGRVFDSAVAVITFANVEDFFVGPTFSLFFPGIAKT